jgi:hypothetical protein
MRKPLSIRRVLNRLAIAVLVVPFAAALSLGAVGDVRACDGGLVADEETVSRGVNLEVRLLHLRIEFPWMRALPVTPGHRIVISVLATEPEPSL